MYIRNVVDSYINDYFSDIMQVNLNHRRHQVTSTSTCVLFLSQLMSFYLN